MRLTRITADTRCLMPGNKPDLLEQLLSWFAPGIAWHIGGKRLLRVDSEYPPPRFVYWPDEYGASALLSEAETRELLARMILSSASGRDALLQAVRANASSPELLPARNEEELLEQFLLSCPELAAQARVEESLEDAVEVITQALSAGHRIEWSYREMMFDWSIAPATGALIYTQDNGEHSFERHIPAHEISEHIRRTLSPNGETTDAPNLAANERMYVSQAVLLLGAGTLRAWIRAKQSESS